MEKKFVLNRVDLGQRVTGYEVFNPSVNGGEVIWKKSDASAENAGSPKPKAEISFIHSA